jgi:hydroxymethylglutaryl-CoA reductase/dihydroflavonol-4-reductase
MVALPAGPMKALSALYMGAIAKRFDLPQRLTPGSITILRMRRHANTAKAQNELGFVPTNIRDAVAEAFEFYHREGMIPRHAFVAVPGRADEVAAQ